MNIEKLLKKMLKGSSSLTNDISEQLDSVANIRIVLQLLAQAKNIIIDSFERLQYDIEGPDGDLIMITYDQFINQMNEHSKEIKKSLK